MRILKHHGVSIRRVDSHRIVSAFFTALYLLGGGMFLPVSHAGIAQNDPNELERLVKQVEACGSDMGCINRLQKKIQGLSDKILADMPSASMSDSHDEEQELKACGLDQDCALRLFTEIKDPKLSIPNMKRDLVACGGDQTCSMRVFDGVQRQLQAICGNNSSCKGVGMNDFSIANAWAEIELDKRKHPKLPIPEAKPERARMILAKWQTKLVQSLPKKVLAQISQHPDTLPISDNKRPSLQFVKDGGNLKLRVVFRDSAYSLQGAMLLQAGLARKKNDLLLDLAMWNLIRAALLKEDAEHLSNIAFVLMLGEHYEEARDLLARALQLDNKSSDTHGNMALTMRRLGHDKVAEQESDTALALDLVDESGEQQSGKETEAITVAPPNDRGLAFLLMAREHTPQFLKFYKRYEQAATIPLDKEFVRPTSSGNYIGVSPRAVLMRRDLANRKALDQCEAAIQEPPGASPFGWAIAHPGSKGLPSREEATLLRLKYEKEMCKCNLEFAERDVKHYKQFVNEQTRLVKRFDKTWTPQLEHTVRYWRRWILTLNRLYEDMPPEQGRWVFPWPDQFYLLLVDHDADLKHFSHDWIKDANEEYGMRLAAWRKWQDKCRQANAEFENYRIAFAFRGPIRCEPLTGKTYSLNFDIDIKSLGLKFKFSVAYFIPDSTRGDIAFNIDANVMGVGGSYTSSVFGATTYKGTVGVGPVTGEIHGGSGKRWGTDFAIDVAGALPGTPFKRVFSTVYAGGNLSSNGVTGYKPRFGYTEIKGNPPAWVRLRAKSGKSDRRPLWYKWGLTNKMPIPDC